MAVEKQHRVEEPVRADVALYEALGPGARLWDSRTIADRLIDKGFVIRRVRNEPAALSSEKEGSR